MRRFSKACLVMVLALIVAAVLAPATLAAEGTGNSVGWAFFKNDEFSTALTDNEFGEFKGMIATGTYALIPITDKWSLGFNVSSAMGWSRGEVKSARLDLGYGGLAVEYGIPLGEVAHFGIGAVVGGGMAELATKQGTIADFDEALGAANSAKVWRPYLLAQPQAAITFAASPTVDVTISGGYSFLYSPTGWMDGFNFKQQIEGPLKTVGMPFIQIGIAFGIGEYGQFPGEDAPINR